jgi:hypothetical protein
MGDRVPGADVGDVAAEPGLSAGARLAELGAGVAPDFLVGADQRP